ncbi:2-oxoglutarate dehydrogenase E1 component, partial [Ceratobasidium sp. 392]
MPEPSEYICTSASICFTAAIASSHEGGMVEFSTLSSTLRIFGVIRDSGKAYHLLWCVFLLENRELIDDDGGGGVDIGQVYYAPLKAHEDRGIKDIEISRLEQISLFPYGMLTPHLDKYPNAELMYAQRESPNCDALTYVAPRIRTASNETQRHKSTYP